MNCCSGNPISRRGFLTVGAVGGLGLTLPGFFRLQQVQAAQKYFESKEGTAKSVIHIFLHGGWGTFDSLLMRAVRISVGVLDAAWSFYAAAEADLSEARIALHEVLPTGTIDPQGHDVDLERPYADRIGVS